MKRTLNICVIILVLLLALNGCKWPGTRIKDHLETVGSELTGTPVTVEKVRVKPVRGVGSIEDLRIANPDGYVARNAISFEKLIVNVGLTSTIAGEPLVLDKLVLAYPVVNFENDENGISNLSVLNQQVTERRERADKQSEKDSDEPICIKIKALIIEGITLNVLQDNGVSRTAILPTIFLEDIGGEKGITPAWLGVTVVGAMTGEILKQAIARELIERAGDIQQALSTDNLMALIDYKLHLAPEMKERIRPIVDEFSRALAATIDGWVEKGHIDLAELEKQFSPIFENFKQRLQDLLDREAFAELKAELPEIKDNAVEVLRYLIIAQIAEHLQMTPEQITELMPVLHDYMRQLSELISDFVADPDKTKDMFVDAYRAIDLNVSDRLIEKLSDEQMEKYHYWRDELLQRIELILDKYR